MSIVQRLSASPGETVRLTVRLETSPSQLGKSGAFQWSGTIDYADLSEALAVDFVCYELAVPASPSVTATVTDVSAFGAGDGPDGEDIHTVTVASIGTLAIGHFVRARGKPSARVYEVVHTAVGRLDLWSFEDGFDVEDGDVLEKVTPTGVYVAFADLSTEDILTVDDPVLSVNLTATAMGPSDSDGPTFSGAFTASWIFEVRVGPPAVRVVAG